MPYITNDEMAEFERLRAAAWKNDRKSQVLEALSDMDEDDGNDWLDDEAEYRMESGHCDSYQMEG